MSVQAGNGADARVAALRKRIARSYRWSHPRKMSVNEALVQQWVAERYEQMGEEYTPPQTIVEPT